MRELMPLIVVLVIAWIALEVFNRIRAARRAGTDAAWQSPFRRKDYLLSPAERSFYEVLTRGLSGRYLVFPKVRLADLLWQPAGTRSRQGNQNRVQSKHVDFVLCRPDTLSPVLVIELDDSSHDREDRMERDTMVDHILETAGLPILHVRAARGYVQAELVAQVEAAVAGTMPQERR